MKSTLTDDEIAHLLDAEANVSERLRPTLYSTYEIRCFRAGYAAGERASKERERNLQYLLREASGWVSPNDGGLSAMIDAALPELPR